MMGERDLARRAWTPPPTNAAIDAE
jgi:hypothetical protein